MNPSTAIPCLPWCVRHDDAGGWMVHYSARTTVLDIERGRVCVYAQLLVVDDDPDCPAEPTVHLEGGDQTHLTAAAARRLAAALTAAADMLDPPAG